MSEKEYIVPVEFVVVANSREAAYKTIRDWFDARWHGEVLPEDTIESSVSLANVKERCAACSGSGVGPNGVGFCSTCGGAG